MSRIEVDGSDWPLLLVELPPTVTDEEMASYLQELREYRLRRQDYAIVIDAKRLLRASAKQRRMQANYVAEGLSLSRRYLKGLAFVSSSSMTRGLLTAIFWLQPPAWPHQVFSGSHQARQWAYRQLACESHHPASNAA